MKTMDEQLIDFWRSEYEKQLMVNQAHQATIEDYRRMLREEKEKNDELRGDNAELESKFSAVSHRIDYLESRINSLDLRVTNQENKDRVLGGPPSFMEPEKSPTAWDGYEVLVQGGKVTTPPMRPHAIED